MGAAKGTRPPNAGKGRPKGVPNKVTTAVKEAIEAAADRLGGVERLVAWVREDTTNERIFWGQIYTKLLPLQVSSDPDAPVIPKSITFVMRTQPNSGNRS